MRSYTIHKIGENPDWQSLPVLTMDIPYLQTGKGVTAFAQIGYTDDALFLHLWMDVSNIRAEEKGPYGTPCEDSCLEFFFQPVPGDDRYINIEFNFNGCYYFGIGTGIHDLMRLVPEMDGADLFSHKTVKTETGWEIFYQIPYSLLRRIFSEAKPEPGMEIRANCFACSDLSQPYYYYSWNPIEGEPFTFHRPQSFGLMKFSNI